MKEVPVIEGKATLLNFTLEEPEGEMVMSEPGLTEQTTITNEVLITPGPSTPKRPIQSLDFRHHSYDEMEMLLQLFSAVHSSITYLYSVGRSVQGKNLYVMEISTNPGISQQGTIIYNHIDFKLIHHAVHVQCV